MYAPLTNGSGLVKPVPWPQKEVKSREKRTTRPLAQTGHSKIDKLGNVAEEKDSYE
jgi:hypothetical protein